MTRTVAWDMLAVPLALHLVSPAPVVSTLAPPRLQPSPLRCRVYGQAHLATTASARASPDIGTLGPCARCSNGKAS
ncbi:hypothetical protein C8Q76DRAFT_726731 [Earliella scabrosa]|nr:hypothetical protein C8Q76DRAFT_726731 [Earliella scabrosa]